MSHDLTAVQRARERSVTIALSLDCTMYVVFGAVAIATGSTTMAAEVLRATLMNAIEGFSLLVMRRIHRGRTAMFEFGSGKVEQLVNLLIAGGMILGVIWIVMDVMGILTGAKPVSTPAAFALAAIIASINTFENAVTWDGVRRAAQDGGSLIMKGQLQARVVKFVSSLVVQATLTVAALSTDAVIIGGADAAGALFVAGFIAHSAYHMMKAGLPDLVDRAVGEEIQAAINRMLAQHFNAYDRLDEVRTRRSGDRVYAEIVLGFGAELTLGEVHARIEAMKASLREEVANADVSILAASI